MTIKASHSNSSTQQHSSDLVASLLNITTPKMPETLNCLTGLLALLVTESWLSIYLMKSCQLHC
jgi:hypothetical protein